MRKLQVNKAAVLCPLFLHSIVVLGMGFHTLPGIVDRSEFSSDYSLQVAITGSYASIKNKFLPHSSCPCDYIYTLLR